MLPSWSRNDESIVFHRRFASTLGPAGIYMMDRDGRAVRLICPGSFAGPTRPRLSPDGSTIISEFGSLLVLVDVKTGARTQPIYTDNGANFGDWSPDGKRIVYARAGRDYLEPPDSAGLHILNLETGDDSGILGVSGVLGGDEPVWSPDGTWIAWLSGTPEGVSIIRPDGTERRQLILWRFGRDLFASTMVARSKDGPSRDRSDSHIP